MHRFLLDLLECPACHGTLDWTVAGRAAATIEEAEARCRGCGASYPVRDGIGVFLLPDLPRNDLWEQVETGLDKYLRENPAVARELMEGPAGALNPADQFYRAMMLEQHGRFDEARALEASATPGLYTPAYLDCWARQMDYVVAQVAAGAGPIVDLASGRGYLAERLVRELSRPVVFTDFSLRALRGDRARLQARGLLERASLLAFDARRTPFKAGAVTSLVTNLGLPNIAEPGDLLSELRRITAGSFLAISHFYPDDDEPNRAAIRAAALETMLYRATALAAFAEAGWQVETANVCAGEARPTPVSALLEGAGIDGLPVAATRLEWCVLRAR